MTSQAESAGSIEEHEEHDRCVGRARGSASSARRMAQSPVPGRGGTGDGVSPPVGVGAAPVWLWPST